MIYLLYNPNCKCFETVINNMKYILDKKNILCEIKHSIDVEERDEDLWVCIWNDLSVLPKKCIIYNMDPMVEGVYNSFINLFDHSRSNVLEFIDYCYSDNINKLKHLNLNYTVIPYGYSSFYEQKYITDDKKKIDILFIGGMSPRRNHLFNIINNFANENRYIFNVWNGVYGEDKVKLINESKIILSISGNDAKVIGTNDLARISQVIALKGLVITEFIGDNIVENKLSKYIDYCDTIEDILGKIKYYMENEEERNRKIENAYNKFKEDFNFENDFYKTVKSCTASLHQETGAFKRLSSDNIQYIIRPINDEDYHRGFLNLMSLLHNYNEDISFPNFKEIQKNIKDQYGYVFVVEDKGKIIGSAKLLIEYKTFNPVGHIEDVVVDKNYRNKGIASSLLTKLKILSKEKKCYKTILDCTTELESFYEKNGFIKQGSCYKLL